MVTISKKYKELPRPKSYMPGPVAPWSNIKISDRKITKVQLIAVLNSYEVKTIELEQLSGNEPKNPTSAVLVPILLELSGQLDSMLLIQRPHSMSSFSGDIAFPGGHLDEIDLDLKNCALRETEEEIGIKSEDIEIIGRSKTRRTKSADLLIAPYIGIISKTSLEKIQLNNHEVEMLHHIKIDDLFLPDNYYSEFWDTTDASHLIHIFRLKDSIGRPVFIWGATAQILFDILSSVNSTK